MNQAVLIITPFFAPQSHAAVFRAYKLAKYLPQYGWKSYVLTTDTNYLYNEDMGLLDALSPEVEIYRSRYIEPSLRGLRMALGGKDRTFKALKATEKLSATATTSTASNSKKSNVINRLYRYLLDAWFRSPDAYWTWEEPTVRAAIQLIQDHQIPLVFTSADPYTSHRIGYRLQQKTGVRWTADFRDPHTHSYGMHSRNHRVFGKQREAERLAVEHADAVTVASESIALILTETYGLNNYPIHFIPTGLDASLLATADNRTEWPGHPYLVCVGEFLQSYEEYFFGVFAQALQKTEVKETGIKLYFIGRIDANAPVLNPIIAKYNLQQHIELIDHIPQAHLYCYIRGAKAGLLIPGPRSRWWCLYAKLVDYIGLRRPVIAVVPNPSEARTHLQQSGLGIFLDGNKEDAVRQLTQFILNSVDLQINEEYCGRFLAKTQIKTFSKVFNRLLTS